MTKLPHNKNLKNNSNELRKAYNLSEALFWNEVKNKQLKGLQFNRQKIIGNYIVDFYCAEKNVVIEIDGCSHDYKGKYDETRNEYLRDLGLEVIHFLDSEIRKHLHDIIEYLKEHPALN